ncbi:sulfate adenylyltransferase [Aphanomyces invadans]|uniref:Sulfate adenylyltransferase n=1 Tax=Aphanomyces invadans TaxID=157072 RepID=A0A024UTA2_9STRA|nr:sulfate adenylyltransferase [Aphanomyces invadans]ETW09152.1 sulfate adenylyltransferase [Aphanomyces invadans]|eukprot:XP_008862957.1 sulfate adenylyltransferase [Aphanomyces invadans]
MRKEIQYTSVKLTDDDGTGLEPMDVKMTQEVRPASRLSWVRTALWWTLIIAPYLALAVVLIAPLPDTNGELCASQRLEKLDMKRNVFYDESVVSEKTRFAAIGQKGATIWMTGLSGSGKSTIGRALEAKLIHDRIQVYRLDGDNVRIGLNRDLGFSAADRQESVRRVGEMAALFAQSGTITIVGLVSPYRAHRDDVRDIHKKMNIPFYEVFVDTPLSVVMARDIKGLYKKAVSGEIKDFTGVSAPYEAPLHADLTLFTPNSTLDAEVATVYSFLKQKGLLTGVDALPRGYPGVAVADGGNAAAHFDTLYPTAVTSSTAPAAAAPRVLLRDEDLHWVQVLGEGWASPLRGFMREGAYLQCLHFSSVVFDADNLTAGNLNPHSTTNFSEYSTADVGRGTRVNMPIPIVLPVTKVTKAAISTAADGGINHVVLVTRTGEEVAVLTNPEVFDHRKEERITRTFGAYDRGHPYVDMIQKAGDFLLGGEIQLLQRVMYNDGLDKFRLTPSELRAKFEALGADAVLAFQTRNPTHAGHAYLMNQGRQWLLDQGFKNPVLWLSPLGGWTKEDDVPLDVRVHQHEAIIKDGMLDPASTVLSIWPSPMVYAGPREVQWHAKSRKNAGASYFVVGRDPAGIKRSDQPDQDMYAGDHGRFVLHLAPGMEHMNLLSFPKVYYDKTDHKMKPMTDKSRKRDFLSISGSKMRHMAKMGFQPCTDIPDTWESDPTCVPPGFMVQSGWNLMVQYYQRMTDPSYLQYSIPFRPFISKASSVASTGDNAVVGTLGFELSVLDAATGAKVSPWHDIPLYVNASVVNFVVEIEKGRMEKMEVNKRLPFNPIKQDVTKTNHTRYYLYGVPFFNYGMLPQTWEDPSMKDAAGHGGDNDPLDVIEIGTATLPMGSVHPVKVLGSLELIDQGEVDHKIVAVSIDDPLASVIHTVDDLSAHRPHLVEQLVDWLKNYKLPEGKPVNVLSQDTMTNATDALAIVAATHGRWQALKDGAIANPGFWLGPTQ